MLSHLARALSSRGVLALLEFRAEDPAVPIKPEHKMSKKQLRSELGANGYEEVRSFDELPWQHLMFFAPKTRQSRYRRWCWWTGPCKMADPPWVRS
jgi:hypothetical protein